MAGRVGESTRAFARVFRAPTSAASRPPSPAPGSPTGRSWWRSASWRFGGGRRLGRDRRPAATEHLASSMRRVDVAAGTRLIEKGDLGDRDLLSEQENTRGDEILSARES
jgi:hypothetical protein